LAVGFKKLANLDGFVGRATVVGRATITLGALVRSSAIFLTDCDARLNARPIVLAFFVVMDGGLIEYELCACRGLMMEFVLSLL
jgi:hypothetical protein